MGKRTEIPREPVRRVTEGITVPIDGPGFPMQSRQQASQALLSTTGAIIKSKVQAQESLLFPLEDGETHQRDIQHEPHMSPKRPDGIMEESLSRRHTMPSLDARFETPNDDREFVTGRQQIY